MFLKIMYSQTDETGISHVLEKKFGAKLLWADF